MDPSFLSDAQQPWYSDDLNLEQYWDEVPPLDKTIEYGNAMRVVKLRRVPLPRELEVRGIGNKSTCKYHREKSETKLKQKSSARCNCPLNGQKKSKMSRPTLAKKTLTCPLRIMELSAPSKRHCIETWLSKGNILPAYMTDRLQRYITNQTPIVQIPDAIRCFKRKKRIPHSLKSNERPGTKSNLTEKQMAALKVLCGTFGFKVFENLNNEVPHIMPLSADLERVCDEVTKDIISVMAKRKNKNKIRNNNKVISEIANRITIWIAIILKESTYKQLQEEYYEQEEEEGHILDFLDDIVNDVLNTCEPYPQEPKAKQFLRDWSSVSLKRSDGEDKQKYYEEDKCISDYLLNEILNDLDFVEQNNESFDLEEISEHREETDDNDIILPDDVDETNLSATFFDATDLKEEPGEIRESIEKTALIGDQDEDIQKELENTEEDVNDPGKDVSTIDNTSKDQSSEVQENVTDETQEEDSRDETNRKVKFTNDDTANDNLEESMSESTQRKSWQTSEKPNLILGPVNDHLLNDADEVWPEYEHAPPLKITASVSKSITSLGKITEFDEASVITSSADLNEEIIEDKVLNEIELSADDKTMGLESGIEENTLPVETTDPVADDPGPLPTETFESGINKTDDSEVNGLLTPSKITEYKIEEIITPAEISEPDNIETEDLKYTEIADREVNITEVSELTTPFKITGSDIKEDKIPVETSDPENIVVENTDFLPTKTAESVINNIADEKAAELTAPFKISEFDIEENKLQIEISEPDDVEATDLASLAEESTEPLDITETREDGIIKTVESVVQETASDTSDPDNLVVEDTDFLPTKTAEIDINNIADEEAAQLTAPLKISEFEIEENKIPIEIFEPDEVEATDLALAEKSTEPLDITETREDGITKRVESVVQETASDKFDPNNIVVEDTDFLPTKTAESDINNIAKEKAAQLTAPLKISELDIEENTIPIEISEPDYVDATDLALAEESTEPLDITETREDGIIKTVESVVQETASLPPETPESDINTAADAEIDERRIDEPTKPSEITVTNIEEYKIPVEISELGHETDEIDKVASAIKTTEQEINVALIEKQPSIAEEPQIILPTEQLRSPKDTVERRQDALRSALYILSDTKNLDKIESEMDGSPQHIQSPEGPPSPYEEIVKFDYKVYWDTAPSWVRIGSGEPSEEGSTRTLVPQKINERDYRKLCQEIIDVASKIEKGYQWIDNVTSNVNYLKSKHAISKRHGKYSPRLELQDWNKLKRSVGKDVILWTKLCRKAHDKLDRRNKAFADAMASAKYGYRCQCNTRKMKT